MLEWKENHIEICSMADIPAGTGLGSSSSFTTALLRALHTMQGNIVSTRTLAEEACEIEMNRLKEPIGKQDQYIAAYGGITCMNFHKDGYVWVDPLNISRETLFDLEDIPAMNTDSATGPSEGPNVWNDSPGCSEKQLRFKQSFQSARPIRGRP